MVLALGRHLLQFSSDVISGSGICVPVVVDRVGGVGGGRYELRIRNKVLLESVLAAFSGVPLFEAHLAEGAIISLPSSIVVVVGAMRA